MTHHLDSAATRHRPRLDRWLALLAIVASACSGNGNAPRETGDAGGDASSPDAGLADARTAAEARTAADARTADAGGGDAAAGGGDAAAGGGDAAADAAAADGGTTGGGGADGGTGPDAGAMDAGATADAGVMDSGAMDAGSDAAVDGGSSGCPDAYEPNDGLDTAGTLTADTVAAGSVCTDDIDVFEIAPGGAGCEMTVSLTFTHADGDLDLELADSTGTMIDRGISETDDESITITLTGPDPHYLAVYGYEGAVNDYELSFTASCPGAAPACPGDDPYEENDSTDEATPLHRAADFSGALCGSDEESDYYSIELYSGCSFTADLSFVQADGDLDLYLLAPDGSLAYSSITESDDEQINPYGRLLQPFAVDVGVEAHEVVALARQRDPRPPVSLAPRRRGRIAGDAAVGGGRAHDRSQRDVVAARPRRQQVAHVLAPVALVELVEQGEVDRDGVAHRLERLLAQLRRLGFERGHDRITLAHSSYNSSTKAERKGGVAGPPRRRDPP